MHNTGFKLLGVLHEYTCGALWGTRSRVTRLVIAAPASLRHENLCIIPASQTKANFGFTRARKVGYGKWHFTPQTEVVGLWITENSLL